MILSKI